jgi:phosphohistidine swiveling domain-containing protein
VLGLAEPLVSGEAAGEEWVIREGEAECSRTGDGALDARTALVVAALARGVEAEFGVPQDIEWAIDGEGKLFLLQARPMTALGEPVAWEPPGPGLWMRNFRIGEWLSEAMTPLFADWIIPRLESGFLDGMWRSARVRVPFRYAAVNGWYYNAAPAPSARTLWRVLVDSRGRAPWFLYNVLARVSRDPVAADRAVLRRLEAEWRNEVLPAYRRRVEDAGRHLATASTTDVMTTVDEIAALAGAHLWSLAVVGGSAWKMEVALARFWSRHLAGPLATTPHGAAGYQVLLRGLPGAEPGRPPHAVYSLDWYFPTAGEDAAPVASEDADTNDRTRSARIAAGRVEAEAACRKVLAGDPALLREFTGLLAVTQRFTAIREEQARDLTLGWPILRACARRLGADLRDASAIEDSEDVYFLSRAELADPSPASREQTRDRRILWNRRRRLQAPLTLGSPPRLVGDPVARVVAAARVPREVPDGAILGHPASAGRATGRVRIVTGPADFGCFQRGEILVAKATAPAWTPLFGRAAAVVTDGGTLAAHASLIAREYGIPAVVGTGTATTQLTEGQVVTVDGSAGIVLPHAAGSDG